MCGINGFLVFGNTNQTELNKYQIEIENMNTVLSHRGPDDSGVFVSKDSTVFLGHRRLSIIDTSSAGHQPMLSNDGRYVIVFNGEIYNFLKLKKELGGFQFKSRSDTEVLLEYINRFGIEKTIDQLQGMYGFGIYDVQKNKLYLTRDFAGEKSVYYGQINSRFLFSSELRGIESIEKDKLTVCSDSSRCYFEYGYYPGDLTPYRQIKKLLPGELLTVDCISGEWNKKQLKKSKESTEAPVPLRLTDSAFDNIVQQFSNMLDDVVSDQMISDVNLGCFLSGGIDSSLVTAVLAKQSTRKIESFTIGFENPQFDESQKAAEVADHLGVLHNVVRINEEDLLHNVNDAIESLDEPFGNASTIPSYILAKFSKRKVTVCMAGDGGDELFLGYNRYLLGNKYRKLALSIPRLMKPTLRELIRLSSLIPIDSAVEFYSSKSNRRIGVNYNSKIRKLGEMLSCTTNEDIYKNLLSYCPSELITKQKYPHELIGTGNFDFDKDFIGNAAKWDQEYYLPGDCLYKSDRTSMAHSLEVRVPLLDRRIVQFSDSISTYDKLRGSEPKAILKAALKQYVPEQLFMRPKMGFTVPIGDWINGALNSEIGHHLKRESIEDVGILDSAVIDKMLANSARGYSFYDNAIWSAYIFQKWMISRNLGI